MTGASVSPNVLDAQLITCAIKCHKYCRILQIEYLQDYRHVAAKDNLQCRFGFICKSWRCGQWLSLADFPRAMLGRAELTITVPPCQLGYHQGRGCKVAKAHTRCELAANRARSPTHGFLQRARQTCKCDASFIWSWHVNVDVGFALADSDAWGLASVKVFPRIPYSQIGKSRFYVVECTGWHMRPWSHLRPETVRISANMIQHANVTFVYFCFRSSATS